MPRHSDGKIRSYGRQSWRQRSHEQSHSQGTGQIPLAPAVHPLASADPAEIVTTSESLAGMIEHLRSVRSFAFDSEFIGEASYQPRLCLVQVATTQRVCVVDALAGLDLRPLWELVVSADFEKIVLAGQQDFGPAVQSTGQAPANIMDLQIAAGFIHADYPLSLARLVEKYVGVSLGKGLTFTHWDNRPLSDIQIRYAADDVRYLPAARDAVGRQLAQAGLTGWSRQECAAALENISLYQTPPEDLYLRVRGRQRLRRRQLAILRELAIVRDQAARLEDVPARTLLKDEILIEMARRPAMNLVDLDSVRHLPRPVEYRYGRQFVEATARGLAIPEDQCPAKEPGQWPALQERVDQVRAEIVRICQGRSIAPALVAGRKDVVRACRCALDGLPMDEHRLCRGWRRELLGDLLA